MKTMFAIVMSLTLLLSACGSNSGNNNNSEPSSSSNTNSSTNTGEEAPAVDTSPLGKFDPPIELTVVKDVTPTEQYPEGDSVENNIWTRLYKEELGIDVKVLWSALTGDQYDQKVKLQIASDDLPDLMTVSAQQLAQLVENDQVADLTDVFHTYQGDIMKTLFEDDGGIAIESATFGGKIMAIPYQNSALDTSNVLWVRKDWLTKLNLPEPSTMDDVKKIADAFTNQDPDGNGKKDTFGLGLSKNLWGTNPLLEGFFNGYHTYPTIWIETENGLEYGAIQPGAKAALADLQAMYKDGLIDPEFGVKEWNQVFQDVNANKIGMYYGKMSAPFFFMSTAAVDPSIEWQSYPLPSVDGTAAKTQQDFPIQYYTVVKKGYKHPEAAIKLMNFILEVSQGTSELHDRLFNEIRKPEHDAAVQATLTISAPLIKGGPALGNLNQYLNINKAIDTNDLSVLATDEQKSNYEATLDYINTKNPASFGTYSIVGPNGPFKVLNQYHANNQFLVDAFIGAATETMVTKQSTIDKFILEEFTKIIVGNKSVDEFDQLVSTWKNLGGEQITKEVNEWYAAR